MREWIRQEWKVLAILAGVAFVIAVYRGLAG